MALDAVGLARFGNLKLCLAYPIVRTGKHDPGDNYAGSAGPENNAAASGDSENCDDEPNAEAHSGTNARPVSCDEDPVCCRYYFTHTLPPLAEYAGVPRRGPVWITAQPARAFGD